MKTRSVSESRFLESDFFERADTLWDQLQDAVTKGTEAGSGPLRTVTAADAYTFLLATADQVFKHDLVLAFLNGLRRWGKEKLDVRHVSTPQIHVYVEGCRRELAPDATPAQWHYLYSLTRSEAPSMELLWEDELQRKWFGIVLDRVDSFRLHFNELLVHEAGQSYALEGPIGVKKPLDGEILLHGYLW